MENRKYYEAYDDRYRQIHSQNLRWFAEGPTAIVSEVMDRYGIDPSGKLLEIGCGEGRDARYLLGKGCNLLATDISAEAVAFCREENPEFADCFQILDCLRNDLGDSYDYIYAVAVIHMLVEEEDRNGFYGFYHRHLTPGGIGLICSMGDGEMERSSDISSAFALQERIHEQSGVTVHIAGTSCRMVSFASFRTELEKNGLAVLETGITAAEPDFSKLMYAVVKRK